ncbi:MAG: efflux RND transporter periplasmic adaptor subunit, partial [Clostridia bacterium]|nr:efflux RND transporter periplasmic adaptor subunit [Clostridia bacterium]
MKLKILFITILAFFMAFASGCGFLPVEDEKLSPPIKEPKEIEYKTQTVFYSDISKEISLFAQWSPSARVSYSFTEYNAPFLEYRVSIGDQVRPGDILAVLDIGDIDKELRDMDISYQRQKLSYERALERYEAGTASWYDLRLAELDFEDVTNKYNDLKKKKADSMIVSDIEGTVLVMMDFKKGDMIRTGTNLISLVENEDIMLTAASSLVRTNNVGVGQEAIIEYEGGTMKATISRLEGSTVELQPEFMLDGWKLGSTVKAMIPLESAKGVLVV